MLRHWITLSEIRLGLRLIAKQPVLSITVVLALATGIGLATVGFTLREALLHSQLPFPNGDRFVRLVLHSDAEDNVQLDLAAYHAIRDTSNSFAHLGAVGEGEYALEGEDGTVEAIRVGLVTPRSFRFLPAVPIVGRVLTAGDGVPGAEPVVLIRESLWRRRFGSRPSIVGEPVHLSAVTRTVVGVLPDTFKFPSAGEIWVPLDEATLAGRAGVSGASELTVFGILRDGLAIDGATAELSAYSRPERQNQPGTATSVLALPFTGDDDTINTVMSGLVAVLVMVLLVAASNIASLVSARTWSRSSELAVRTALGARRSRLVGQLFVEVALLGAIASVIGLAFAQVALDYLAGMISDIPFWMTFDPTIRTMAFVVALGILVSVVSGLGPALKVTSVNLNGALHAHGRGSAAGGFGSVGRVLVVEVALSVALLNCALVTARALASYIDDIPALPKGQVLTARLSGEESKAARDRLLAMIRAFPGVVSAGAASHLPRLDPAAMPILIEPLDRESPVTGSAPTMEVSDGFLESIGGRTLAGRSFTANDFLAGAAPVAIVNQPFVDRFFNGRSPVGRRLNVSTEGWREVVGVVPDLGVSAGDRARAAGVYLPLPDRTPFLHLAIRTAGNPHTTAGPLRRAVADVDPNADLRGIRLLEDVGREQRSFLSGMTSAMMALGLMALLLSVVSIYALLSFMVTRRTREIGIRVALGARRAQVLATVAGSALALLAAGAALGTFAGVALAGFQSVMLIRMPGAGVMTPAMVIGALALASLAAAWLPTRRALGIRPAEALASE
jgi:predicted permease